MPVMFSAAGYYNKTTTLLHFPMCRPQWLQTEALPSNPKIMVTPESKYQFKPPYDLRDRKTMLKLLRKHDLKGYGGLLLEDVQESLPNCDRIMKVTRQRRARSGAVRGDWESVIGDVGIRDRLLDATT